MRIQFLFLFSIQYLIASGTIKRLRNFDYPTFDDFVVYWNAPTFLCQKHNIHFENTLRKYGITVNYGDSFRGDDISILYDTGSMPAVLVSSTTGRKVIRNGGIPQKGNITHHLQEYEKATDVLIPPNTSGIVCIDSEIYRPIWRQNWNRETIYLNMSKDDVRQKHPQWTELKILQEARRNFEAGCRVFFETTLEVSRAKWKKAKIGYYGYPYCFNMRKDNSFSASCSKEVQLENNRIQWLWDASSALFPSVYTSCHYTEEQQVGFVRGRMNEAFRVATRSSTQHIIEVYPYLWYKYYDKDEFLTPSILQILIEEIMQYKMGGLIIWGATNDVASAAKCQKVMNYLTNVLGPTIQRIKHKFSQSTNEVPTSKPPSVFSELYNFKSPDVIFTAINDKNESKSIFHYRDSLSNPGQHSLHPGNRYSYTIETDSSKENSKNEENKPPPSPPPRPRREMGWWNFFRILFG